MADIKNDIKIMFYIIHTLTWLIPGIILFGISVSGLEYTKQFKNEEVTSLFIGFLVTSLLSLPTAALGYVAAVLEKKIILFVYAAIMGLAILKHLCVCFGLTWFEDGMGGLGVTIMHLIATVMSLTLAVLLARRTQQHTDQGMVLGPASAPTMYTPRM